MLNGLENGGNDDLRNTLQAARLGAIGGEDALGNGGVKAETKKGLGDVVSEADKIADSIACVIMKGHYPNAVIIGEETCPNNLAEPGRSFVTVDGLDGSAAAVAGKKGQYGTMVALADLDEEMRVSYRAAAVVHPFTRIAYYASAGKGAWRKKGINGEALRLSAVRPGFTLEQGHVVFNRQRFDQYEDPKVTKLMNAMRDEKNLGRIPQQVLLDLPNSVVGLRVFDQRSSIVAVIHDSSEVNSKQEIWDKAPVFAIGAEVAGVVIKTLDGKDPSIFEHAPVIIAANQEIYDQIMSLLE